MNNVEDTLASQLCDAVDSDLADEIASFMKKQEPLGEPFVSILNENLSEMYEN